MAFNIVLVEPEIPQNAGNIARTCAVTGARLHLVRPMGFTVDDKKLKHAGLDYWHMLDITYYDSLSQFLEIHKEDAARFFFFSTKKTTLPMAATATAAATITKTVLFPPPFSCPPGSPAGSVAPGWLSAGTDLL
jgi:tRNA (cytidine(34)-2'-O)-methyltransferase